MKFTIAYTLLFFYVIAAIFFWGYSLNKQSKLIYALEQEKINLLYNQQQSRLISMELHKARDKKIRRTKQYLGEGSTFILIIILSAGIVYYSYYRQQKLNKLQQNFMLSITHELKTPIAGIKLNMQTLEKHKLDEDIKLKLVKSSVQETNRLNDLCNNILMATQLEDSKQALYTEKVELVGLIHEIIVQIKERYPNLNILEELSCKSAEVSGDKSLWQLVISNLLENARKYSGDSKDIIVSLSKQSGNYYLQVKDFGIGIPDEEKKKIFDKFYRIGNENTRTSKGTGLGLFIVKKIVRLYKYDITVKNNQPKGSIFEVRFS